MRNSDLTSYIHWICIFCLCFFQRKISGQLYLMFLPFPVVCWHCFSESTESSNSNKAVLTSPAEAWRQNVFYTEWDHTSLFILCHLNSTYSQSVWIYTLLQSIQSSLAQLGLQGKQVTNSSFSSGVLNFFPNFFHAWLILNQQKSQNSPWYLLRMVQKEKIVRVLSQKWTKKGWYMIWSNLRYKNGMICAWNPLLFYVKILIDLLTI